MWSHGVERAAPESATTASACVAAEMAAASVWQAQLGAAIAARVRLITMVRRPLPWALSYFSLASNRSAGLAALALPLQQLPMLYQLYLNGNLIGDNGVAALLAPGAGAWPSLVELSLQDNRIGDAGCVAFVSGLAIAMPALKDLALESNPASLEALAAVDAAVVAVHETTPRGQTTAWS